MPHASHTVQREDAGSMRCSPAQISSDAPCYSRLKCSRLKYTRSWLHVFPGDFFLHPAAHGQVMLARVTTIRPIRRILFLSKIPVRTQHPCIYAICVRPCTTSDRIVAQRIACRQERAKIPLRLFACSMCDVLLRVLDGPWHGRLIPPVLMAQVDTQVDTETVWP